MIIFINCTIAGLFSTWYTIFWLFFFFKSKSWLPYPELLLFKVIIELVLRAGNFKISEFKLIIKTRNSSVCMRH